MKSFQCTKCQYKAVSDKRLDEHEKIVSVMGDEIYTAKRAEFSGGTFYGYELGEPTKEFKDKSSKRVITRK